MQSYRWICQFNLNRSLKVRQASGWRHDPQPHTPFSSCSQCTSSWPIGLTPKLIPVLKSTQSSFLRKWYHLSCKPMMKYNVLWTKQACILTSQPSRTSLKAAQVMTFRAHSLTFASASYPAHLSYKPISPSNFTSSSSFPRHQPDQESKELPICLHLRWLH